MTPLLMLVAAGLLSDSRTDLLVSGDAGAKIDIVFIGDGYTSAEQDTFNTLVDGVMLAMTDGPLGADASAFNIARVNLDTATSGIGTTRYVSDDPGGDSCNGNLVLDGNGNAQVNATSGSSGRFGFTTNCRNDACWFAGAADSQARIDKVVADYAPGAEAVVIVLNTDEFGACSGTQIVVTKGINADTLRHELSHLIGNLGDEYISAASPGQYTGPEPGWLNVTATLSPLKWARFVAPGTPIPTTSADVPAGREQSFVGAFEGATPGFAGSGANKNLWRPTSNSIMNGGVLHNPIGFKKMMDSTALNATRHPSGLYPGDFDGDGSTDLLVHRETQLDLYLGKNGELVPTWFQATYYPGWEFFLPHDRFHVGDFDGDGKDDVYVVNVADFSEPNGQARGFLGMMRSNGHGFDLVKRYDGLLPGWDSMERGDRFFVGDFDGDGKADLGVTNHTDFPTSFLGILRSTGAALESVQRYDGVIPGWQMAAGDVMYVGDFDGDDKDDLVIDNAKDWAVGYLTMFVSTGSGFTQTVRYDGEVPGWDDLLDHDRFFVGDIDNDGRDDLYAWNPDQWDQPYLSVFRSDGSGFAVTATHAGSLPGWWFSVGDDFLVADVDGNGMADLVGWTGNASSLFSTLGMIRSTAAGLVGSYSFNSVGQGTASSPLVELASDAFVPIAAEVTGGAGWQDLILFQRRDLGSVPAWADPFALFDDVFVPRYSVLQSFGTSFDAIASYPDFIANFEYEASGFW